HRHRHDRRRQEPRARQARGARRTRGAADRGATRQAEHPRVAVRVALVVLLAARVAAAQGTPAAPPTIDPGSDVSGPAMPASPAPASSDPAVVLREANTAATGGDWARVSALLAPLLQRQLEQADLAEAHRLAGLAAFFANQTQLAEQHF